MGVQKGEALGRGEGNNFWENQNTFPPLGNRYQRDLIMAIIFDPPWEKG